MTCQNGGKQKFLSNNKNVILIYGPKNDGNLYYKHKLMFLKGHLPFDGFYYRNDLITVVLTQEESSINLIICEIIYALTLQSKGVHLY